MQHESTQKLFGGDDHLALLAAVSVVLPPEGDLAVGNGDETVIGDGDTMGIAGQVVENMFGAAEGWLGVDDPVLLAEFPEQVTECARRGKLLE